MFRNLGLLLAALLLVSPAAAQMSITATGTAVTQNFDGIGATATAALPSGWKADSGTATTVYGSAATATTQAAGSTGTGAVSSSSQGGTYNWANGITASSTDRAVGWLTSGSVSSPRNLFVQITNNTGQTLSSLDIAYDVEKIRSGSRAFTITFFSSSDGSAWTAQTSGDVSYAADTNTSVIYNPPVATSRSFTLTGLSIANGASIYLRWAYTGSGGSTNAQGLGIDNFSVTAPTPLDTTPPTVSSIVRQTPSAATTNAASVTYRVTFSEAITAATVNTGDFTLTASGVTGASVTGVSTVNTTTFDVTVNTGSGDGTLRLDVLPAATITDTAGNDYNATYTSGASYTIDKTAPTVAIGAPSVSITSAGPVDFPVTVTGATSPALVAGNVNVTWTGVTGTVSILNGSTASPTIRVSGITGDGMFSLKVNAGVYADAVGNTSALSAASAVVAVDNTPPSVTIDAPSVSATTAGPVDFPVTVIGAATTALDAGDISVTWSGSADGTVSILNGSTDSPTIRISGITGDGSFSVKVNAGVYVDAEGNASVLSAASASVTVDNTAPSVVIGAPSVSATTAGPVDFPVTVTGAAMTALNAGDISVTWNGSADGAVSILNGSTASPTIRISGITGDGSFSLAILAGVYIDALANSSAASAASAPVSVDNTAPAANASISNPTSQTLEVAFDGPVVGATTPANYVLSGPGLGTVAPTPDSVTALGGNAYRLNWTSGEMLFGQPVTVTISNVTDAAGNPLGASNVASGIAVPVELSGFVIE